MNLNWRVAKALNHLAVFEVAVEQGSFTKAAAVLGTTQPSISRHIGALEDMLEVQLPKSSETVFLPFTNAAVPTVDLASGRIVADPPDGLF